jgi:hypothetical protein
MNSHETYWQQGLTTSSVSIDEEIKKAFEEERQKILRDKYPILRPLKVDDKLQIGGFQFHANVIDNGGVSLVWNHNRNKKVEIKKVIFNAPATIVFWSDGDKTIVKATNESFDREKGLAMAISKKFLGGKGNYFNTFRKFIEEEE